MSASVTANVEPPVASAMLASVGAVGRHGDGDEPVAAVDRDRAGQRPEGDRVDRDMRPASRGGRPPPARARRASGRRPRGGRSRRRLLPRGRVGRGRPRPVDADEVDAACERVADRRPEAGRERAIPLSISRRSVVGAVTTTGSSANATRPTLTGPGTWSTNDVIAAARGLEPARGDVLRVHRVGDVDHEHDRATDPRSSSSGIRGRATRDAEERDRAPSRSAGDEVPPPARPADDGGEHREVRERDRGPRRPPLDPEVRGEREHRHEQRREQPGRAEGEPAKLIAPSRRRPGPAPRRAAPAACGRPDARDDDALDDRRA